MKRKGFTLIELLAVIVVLSIIAVIVTPVVTKTIKNAKKGSAEIATQNYIRAVDLAISNSELNRRFIPDGEYSIDSDGNLTGAGLPDGKLEIDISGDRPTGGTIVIKRGEVTTDSTIAVGDYEVVYNPDDKKYEATKQGSLPTITVYRWSEDEIKIGDIIDPSDSSKFTIDSSTLEKNYYLKHKLTKNNKVIKSYACIKTSGKEYCLTNGEYGYKENESDYTGSALILKSLRDENKADEYLSCSFNENEMYCINPGVALNAHSNDSVDSCGSLISQGVEGVEGYCYVLSDGSSHCTSN